MTTIIPSMFLKRVLVADAAVSGASAALQLAATGLLAEHTALSTGLLRGTGLFLVAYVALLLGLAVRERAATSLLWLVIAGNVAWALAAVALAIELHLPPLGAAFALLQALAVSAFAYLEYRGLELSARTSVGSV